MKGKPFFLKRWTIIMEEERSVSWTRFITYSLRKEEDWSGDRVDSMRLRREGMLAGPWMQARIRNSPSETDCRQRSTAARAGGW